MIVRIRNTYERFPSGCGSRHPATTPYILETESLITVAGKPLLGHILDNLAALPVEKLVCIVGHLGEQIEHCVRTEYRLPAEFVTQHELRGQAHAIHLAQGRISGPTLILFVDTLLEADLL